MADLPAVLVIKKSGRQSARPFRQDTLHKSLLLALFLAIVREHGLVTRQKPAHEDQIAILIHADSHHPQSLGSILLGQLVQHRVFVAARLAPSSPEIDQDRLAL